MYWQEPQDEHQRVSERAVDVSFDLRGRAIPVDHAYALEQAVLAHAPWLRDDPHGGIHYIYVAGSQNGWERPAFDGEQWLMLSRRTKLAVRASRARLTELQTALQNRVLDLDGCALHVGAGKARPLDIHTTLLSRHIVCADREDEERFLHWVAAELRRHDIPIRKALCGKRLALRTPTGPLPTRSLLLADLRADEALRLQEYGLGPARTLGCGLFIPHKGIAAVGVASG